MRDLITDDMIAAAQNDADAAAVVADLAERTLATAEPPTEELITSVSRAQVRHRQAATRVDRLRAAKAEQDTSLATRTATEKTMAKELAGIGKELAESRDKALTAIQAAEKAMAALLTEVGRHDALVRHQAAALRARGLVARDEWGTEHASGAGERDQAVKVRGEYWIGIEPATVLARSVYGVTRSLYGEVSHLAMWLRRFGGAHMLDQRPDGLPGKLPAAAPDRRVPVRAGQFPDRIRTSSGSTSTIETVPGEPVDDQGRTARFEQFGTDDEGSRGRTPMSPRGY